MINQLRKSFPATITSDTVKKLGLAPNNESYVINTLQFIGVIDKDGKKTEEAAKVFSKHKDEDFFKAFENFIKKSYDALFELHGDHTWELTDTDLITFFRQNDQTSEAIGRRQAATFRILAGLAGHGEQPEKVVAKKQVTDKKPALRVRNQKANSSSTNIVGAPPKPTNGKDFGLTVRVEINLPSDGSKDTYDNIFKSIRENLLNE